MARTFVDDNVDLYRVRIFSKQGTYQHTYGPYATAGKAKSQGSRETGTSMRAYSGREGSYKVQKLVAVLEWEDQLGYENDVTTTPIAKLRWIDVNV